MMSADPWPLIGESMPRQKVKAGYGDKGDQPRRKTKTKR
jgi:hypothetical protein